MADESSGSRGRGQQKGKRAEAGKAVLAVTHRRISKVASERETGTMPTTSSVEAMIEEIETTLQEMQSMSKERAGSEMTTTKGKKRGGKEVRAVKCSKETTLKTICEEEGDGDSDGSGMSDKTVKATCTKPVDVDITRGSEEVINRFRKVMQRADTLLKDQREWIDGMKALRLEETAERERKKSVSS